ncbi:MAG: hypothetical protein HC923_12300 [Myxococcales bacterium]|nr:hypothetical protein [Myxococcales bacterium]
MPHLLVLVALEALPRVAEARGVAARLIGDWAVRGDPVRLRVDVDDPTGVVDRVVVMLIVDEAHTLTATASRSPYEVSFPAQEVWGPSPVSLAAKVELIGRRGGLLLTLGDPFPSDLEIVDRATAESRIRDWAEADARESEPFPSTWWWGSTDEREALRGCAR